MLLLLLQVKAGKNGALLRVQLVLQLSPRRMHCCCLPLLFLSYRPSSSSLPTAASGSHTPEVLPQLDKLQQLMQLPSRPSSLSGAVAAEEP